MVKYVGIVLAFVSVRMSTDFMTKKNNAASRPQFAIASITVTLKKIHAFRVLT